MADQNPTDRGATGHPDPVLEDLREQAYILELVLANWPIQLTVADLEREMDATDFSGRDRVGRAIRDLGYVGLVMSCCGAVLPTRAALRFRRLETAL